MQHENQALDILGTYLTSSAAAPLNKEYIETDSPLWFVHALLAFGLLT